MISVLTPSNRNIDGLLIIEKALLKQDVPFEWIVGAPVKPELSLPFVYVPDPPKEEGDYWVLNKLYNRMIEKSVGNLIVSVQDYTSFLPTSLERFSYFFGRDPYSIVSGVGNKYSDDAFTTKVWQDPREVESGGFYECPFSDIEGNFCAVPKSALYEVGGFDERLDKWAGMDWFSTLARIKLSGKYKFFLDQANKSFSLTHGRYESWEERNAIHGPYDTFKEEYYQNYKLKYLRE